MATNDSQNHQHHSEQAAQTGAVLPGLDLAKSLGIG